VSAHVAGEGDFPLHTLYNCHEVLATGQLWNTVREGSSQGTLAHILVGGALLVGGVLLVGGFLLVGGVLIVGGVLLVGGVVSVGGVLLVGDVLNSYLSLSGQYSVTSCEHTTQDLCTGWNPEIFYTTCTLI